MTERGRRPFRSVAVAIGPNEWPQAILDPPVGPFTDVANLREIWGDAAVYLPPDDDLALENVLDRLAFDYDYRRERAARARARASTLTPNRMADGIVAAYADVLSSHRPGQAGPCDSLSQPVPGTAITFRALS